MRDIKFKAWDKLRKLMFDIYDLGKDQSSSENGVTCPNSDLEIMQYTGLKDKNGKEIYEGDILMSIDSENNPIYKLVFFDREAARFAVHHLPKINIPNFCGLRQEWLLEFSYQVIGNIYENPELLKD